MNSHNIDPSLPSWYCGLSFLEKYRFGKFLRQNIETHPSDFFFNEGWLGFLKEIYAKLDKHHYDTNCQLKISEASHKDRDHFKLNVFYHYHEHNNNQLIWPDFPSLTEKNSDIETKKLKTLDILLEVMRMNNLMPRKLKKTFLGDGTIKLKGKEPKRFNIFDCNLAFYPAHQQGAPLSRTDYPDVTSLKTLLQSIHINTQKSSPRGILLRNIIENEIEPQLDITIHMDRKLRNLFVIMNESGTLADILNVIAEKLDVIWDWEGKKRLYLKGAP